MFFFRRRTTAYDEKLRRQSLYLWYYQSTALNLFGWSRCWQWSMVVLPRVSRHDAGWSKILIMISSKYKNIIYLFIHCLSLYLFITNTKGSILLEFSSNFFSFDNLGVIVVYFSIFCSSKAIVEYLRIWLAFLAALYSCGTVPRVLFLLWHLSTCLPLVKRIVPDRKWVLQWPGTCRDWYEWESRVSVPRCIRLFELNLYLFVFTRMLIYLLV